MAKLAEAKGVTPYQVALAWLLAQENIIVIPKAGNMAHMCENAAAREIILTKEEMTALNVAFPPPKKRRGLDML